jgi:hypothetical protein
MSNFGDALVAALLLSTVSRGAAPPVKTVDPLKGVVLGNEVVMCVLEKGINVDAHVHTLSKDRQGRGRTCSFSNRSPLRWQIGEGAFWVSHDWSNFPGGSPEVGGGTLKRFDLASFSKGEKLWNREDANFSIDTPASGRGGGLHSPLYSLYFDYLPAGKLQARQFMATNIRRSAGLRERDSPEEGAPLIWTFSSYIGESRWDKKEGEWAQQPWKHEWTAPAAFKEPFQALSLGDDFYFVTRSGSLYRAAKPAKGKDRVLARVWDGKKQRIESFITDSATGKTFLFVPPAKAGGRPAYFELSDKPKLVDFDPKLVPLPKLDEPHRTILHNSRVLVALKKIEGKAATKAADKERAKP